VTIAVTGATGFIGRHVIAELRRRGVEPIIAARNADSARRQLAGDRIIECDIHSADPEAFDRLGQPSTLIHLAWGGLPNYASRSHFEAELPAHYRFLTELVRAGLNSCLVTGTCLEYGLQAGELDEACSCRPTTPYGFAKETLRRELEFFREDYPFALTWARLFYTYGDGQGASSLYSQLKAAALRGDSTFDMSGGEQLRDYLPVQEVARLLVDLALLRRNAGPVNVCAGQPVSVRRLAESWLREHGWPLELNFGHFPYPEHEPMAFWGARAKLDSLVVTR